MITKVWIKIEHFYASYLVWILNVVLDALGLFCMSGKEINCTFGWRHRWNRYHRCRFGWCTGRIGLWWFGPQYWLSRKWCGLWWDFIFRWLWWWQSKCRWAWIRWRLWWYRGTVLSCTEWYYGSMSKCGSGWRWCCKRYRIHQAKLYKTLWSCLSPSLDCARTKLYIRTRVNFKSIIGYFRFP